MTKTISKHIAKLQKVPHPKSRKTAKLAKQITKASSREKVKLSHHMKTNLVGEKLLWFRDNLDPDVVAYTPALTLELIDRYLGRFDEEAEQIELKHSVGRHRNRQHASREDAIRMTQEREKAEFAGCGLEAPDLLKPKQLQMLKAWTGELRFLQNFKLVRFTRTKLEAMPDVPVKRIEKEPEVEEEETGERERSAKGENKRSENGCR